MELMLYKCFLQLSSQHSHNYQGNDQLPMFAGQQLRNVGRLLKISPNIQAVNSVQDY